MPIHHAFQEKCDKVLDEASAESAQRLADCERFQEHKSLVRFKIYIRHPSLYWICRVLMIPVAKDRD